ncbi:glycosyltransferase [Candidatus Palauibacter sp.]|uniref:glycosyltransferase n=1 Tax=Candidatus Palauibacter sp. TaxID=3101350 RepID=UPI003B0291DE
MSDARGPRVSVLLPCRDAEPFLADCIASLGAQSERRFEVLALDDGSTDGTGSLLDAWAGRDPRVRLVDGGGSGVVAALRRLSREARAPIIARMDADDIARPGRFAAQLRLLAEHPGTAACGTGVRYFPRPAPGSGYRRYEAWLNGLAGPAAIERDLFVECPIAHPTLMVRRAAFEAVGGYRETDGPEDYDLILRLAAAGHGLANVPETLHEWRLGSHRLSERSSRYAPEAFRRLKAAFLSAGRLPPGRPLVIWGAGRVGKAFARTWLESDGTFDAFVDLDPRKIGQNIHGATVIRPADLATFGAPARPYVLLAVGTPGARDEIREALGGLNFKEIVDYRAVA